MRKKVRCCLAMAAIVSTCGTFTACSGGAVPDDGTQEAIASIPLEDFWKTEDSDSAGVLKFATGLEIVLPDEWVGKVVLNTDLGPEHDPIGNTLTLSEKLNYILSYLEPRDLQYVEGDAEKKKAYEQLFLLIDKVQIVTEHMEGFTPCTIDGELGREQTNHVENVLINQEGVCEVFDAEVENITGMIRDIEALAWIAPRGGAGIVSEGREIKEIENEYITQSNLFLSNETDAYSDDSSQTWIRIVRTPVPAQTGTTESGYKDIIVYKQDDNACLAVQSSENQGVWTLWELPQYGVWLEKEAAIFMRVATGL